MRILFDGYWWQRGPGANRTVQRELLLAWARRFPEDALTVALRADADATDVPADVSIARTRTWPHAVSNRWELPRIARQERADATVCHNYTPASGRAVVFVHDIMFEEQPGWFSTAERLYFGRMLPWARGAAVVATSSHTEAARIRRHAPSLPDPVVTGLGVPPGLTGAMHRPAAVPPDSEFAVTVGRLNVRKNLETVMRAAAASARITPASPLYIVGGTAHSGRGSRFPDAARSAMDEGRIVLLGSVPDAELAWLYGHTQLAISLSLDEGFGMPSVEAASFGAPLLVSDIPVFRETVGGYARFVPPLDVPAAAAAIDAAWGVRPGGLERAQTVEGYHWDAAAAALRAAIG